MHVSLISFFRFCVAVNVKKNIIAFLVISYLTILFGQRWMVGEDYPGYVLYYDIQFTGFAPTFYLIQNYFSDNGISFILFMSLMLLVILVNFFLFIKFVFPKEYVIFFLIFAISEIFFQQLSQVRQFVAISIFLVSFYKIQHKGRKIYLFYYILACSVHISAV